MELHEEPLTDETLDEVVAFVRSANPFAERALGWDTGRFVDFRWGANTVRAAADPGLFGRLCRIFRDGTGIRAITVNEDDDDREYIITPAVDVAAARHVLSRLVETHRERGAGLVCEISDAEEWLAELFAGAGMTEKKQTGHEWEYDLANLPEPAAVAEGFAIETLPRRGEMEEPEASSVDRSGWRRVSVPPLMDRPSPVRRGRKRMSVPLWGEGTAGEAGGRGAFHLGRRWRNRSRGRWTGVSFPLQGEVAEPKARSMGVDAD